MDLKRLLRPDPPWLHLLIATESEACDLLGALPGSAPGTTAYRMIRGQKAKTAAELFDEFAAALQFPCYFGENWDAFDECLTDLEWLPADAYVLLVLNSIRLLEKEPDDQFHLLLKTLEDAGREWSRAGQGAEARPPRAFHVVLQCSRENEAALRHRLKGVKVSHDALK
jgi:hypothetical protein